ncbi:MAG: hypothetical protein JW768_09085 [Chitinispirillaceae bacterium]|nr:hypothetical protein [Chitinispirillaceae bacterium]
MKTASFILGIAMVLPLVLYAGEFSAAAGGNVSADLYETDYFAGLSPEYRFQFCGNHELYLALPLRLEGEVLFRNEFTQHTRFISLGFEAAWFSELFSAKRIRIVWGPDVYFNYGFPPVTYRTIGDETETVAYPRYLVHSGGITVPVCFECTVGKRWAVRLTERLLGVQADSRWVEGYSSTIRITAGIKPTLSPAVAVIYYFKR